MPPDEIARHSGRSHPPSLVRLAERTIRDEALIKPGDIVLCACSGGPDSTALLDVLARLRRKFGFALVAHGVDHGLRPDAAAELDHPRQLAKSLGVPFGVTRVTIDPGGNIQARARAARREALRKAATEAGSHLIATGHTADDRAETFLLRLLRGAGPRGLAIMPPSALLDQTAEPPQQDNTKNTLSRDETEPLRLIRPLLSARRADVMAHLGRHRLPYATDPSNEDARFLRVRVRRELLPLLESMSPQITPHLCALADMLSAELPPPDSIFRGMGRAQRQAVARAKKCERPVKLRLSGGKDVVVGFSDDRPILMESERRRRA